MVYKSTVFKCELCQAPFNNETQAKEHERKHFSLARFVPKTKEGVYVHVHSPCDPVLRYKPTDIEEYIRD